MGRMGPTGVMGLMEVRWLRSWRRLSIWRALATMGRLEHVCEICARSGDGEGMIVQRGLRPLEIARQVVGDG